VGTQLRLLTNERRRQRIAPLDARTRRIGREGVAEARRVLSGIRPPAPRERTDLRRAG
jgi:hypothetical protein